MTAGGGSLLQSKGSLDISKVISVADDTQSLFRNCGLDIERLQGMRSMPEAQKAFLQTFSTAIPRNPQTKLQSGRALPAWFDVYFLLFSWRFRVGREDRVNSYHEQTFCGMVD